ncbi:hypothetical protein HPB50_028250 [Hyalomma asiaticum]|nr:hypothetical protein HPB50_028250 [Hyalomma asiaticum]
MDITVLRKEEFLLLAAELGMDINSRLRKPEIRAAIEEVGFEEDELTDAWEKICRERNERAEEKEKQEQREQRQAEIELERIELEQARLARSADAAPPPPAENQQVRLCLHWLLHGVADEDVSTALAAFGKVVQVTREPNVSGGMSAAAGGDGTTVHKGKEPVVVAPEPAAQTGKINSSIQEEVSEPMEATEPKGAMEESSNAGAPGKRFHEKSAEGSEATRGKTDEGPPAKTPQFTRNSIRPRANVHAEEDGPPPHSSGSGPPGGAEDV